MSCMIFKCLRHIVHVFPPQGYELTKGTVTGSFCSSTLAGHLPEERKMCLTQEFGTVSPTTVGLVSCSAIVSSVFS